MLVYSFADFCPSPSSSSVASSCVATSLYVPCPIAITVCNAFSDSPRRPLSFGRVFFGPWGRSTLDFLPVVRISSLRFPFACPYGVTSPSYSSSLKTTSWLIARLPSSRSSPPVPLTPSGMKGESGWWTIDVGVRLLGWIWGRSAKGSGCWCCWAKLKQLGRGD